MRPDCSEKTANCRNRPFEQLHKLGFVCISKAHSAASHLIPILQRGVSLASFLQGHELIQAMLKL